MSIVISELTRAIAHEVIKITPATPQSRNAVFSNSLLPLTEGRAQDLIIERLNSTLGRASKCVDIQVDVPTTFIEMAYLLDCTDQDFIAHSQLLATSLSNAQTSGSIKEGVAVFMQGKCFYNEEELRFITAIKADPDQGLQKVVVNGQISLDYVNELLFGNSQRLLKIGFFIEEQPLQLQVSQTAQRSPSDFSIKVFDHLMDNSSDNHAAAYFYQTFLGCKLAETSAKKSKEFFETTNDFIMNNSTLTQEEKESCRGGLFALMRGNTATLEPQSVARELFPQEIQDAYIGFCREKGIQEAFTKDNSLIASRLKKRTIKFSSNVTLYAPTDIISDNVIIENQDANGWTNVKIRGMTVR